MAMAMAISIRVPTIAWRIPPCESGAVGLIADMSWVRKRTLVNACHPLTKVKMTALARAATTITDAISSVAVTRRSMTIGRGLDTDTTTAWIPTNARYHSTRNPKVPLRGRRWP